MRIKFWAICLLFMVCSLAESKRISYGFAGGLSLNGFHDYEENSFEYTNMVGAQLGGFVDYKIRDNLSVQPEILFNVKGGKITRSYPVYDEHGDFISNGVNKYECSYSYFELPILLKYHRSNSKFEVQPYLGLSLGYLFRAKEHISQGYSNSYFSYEYSYTSDALKVMNRPESSLCVGMDIKFTNKVIGGLRYNYGLSEIYDKHENQDSGATYHSPKKTKQLMLKIGHVIGK